MGFGLVIVFIAHLYTQLVTIQVPVVLLPIHTLCNPLQHTLEVFSACCVFSPLVMADVSFIWVPKCPHASATDKIGNSSQAVLFNSFHCLEMGCITLFCCLPSNSHCLQSRHLALGRQGPHRAPGHCFQQLFCCMRVCWSHYLAVAIVSKDHYLPTIFYSCLWLLLSNGSTYHSISLHFFLLGIQYSRIM
jgi:hypothetical protein